MKKVLSLLLSLCLVFSLFAMTASVASAFGGINGIEVNGVYCGDVYFTLDIPQDDVEKVELRWWDDSEEEYVYAFRLTPDENGRYKIDAGANKIQIGVYYKSGEYNNTTFICITVNKGHTDKVPIDNVCDICGEAITETETGIEYFYFGSYPQSEVKDTAVTAELDKLAPDWENWTSYGYYRGTGRLGTMVQGDWMRYTDVTYNGEKYRGVKFTQYRPQRTIIEANSRQDDNGYSINNVYWFKFEPLKWRVLDKDAGLVMTETLIDSQPYNNTIYYNADNYWNDADSKIYASNYAESSIRAWLNDDFYNTAFSEDEKTAISKKEIDNYGYGTLIGKTGYEKYDCEKTEDNIFLLSYDEILNTEYGFDPYAYNRDSARAPISTDYAKCQGIWAYDNDTTDWLLRSASDSSAYVRCVYASGKAREDVSVEYSCEGVRPAMTVDLSYYDEPTEPTTPTEEKTLYDYIFAVVIEAIKAIAMIIRSCF